MVIIKNHLGKIRYTKAFFYSLIDSAVTSCFGVAGLTPGNKSEEILGSLPLIKKLFEEGKGINFRIQNGKIRIILHIAVVYGTNTTALVQNIQEKLDFIIKEQTGLSVEDVNVFIDGLVN
ncbi:MAG: Asp23/Gls24 family envelope stress response protein [Ruminiclostridium sp.]|nr:Asp23/Gls24 family envelope stress response protein [Ruminiclostridium sp.]